MIEPISVLSRAKSPSILLVPGLLLAAGYSPAALSQTGQTDLRSDPEPVSAVYDHESCDENARCGLSSIISSVVILSDAADAGVRQQVRILASFTNGGPDLAREVPIAISLPEHLECLDTQEIDILALTPLNRIYRVSELLNSGATIEQLELGQSITFSFQCQGS